MTDEIKEILYWFYDEYPDEERILEKYITNLQNEIFDLKDTIQNKNDCIGAYECIIEDRDKRIDKAVEYIETHKKTLHHYFDEPDCDYWIATNPDDLLNILRGDE